MRTRKNARGALPSMLVTSAVLLACSADPEAPDSRNPGSSGAGASGGTLANTSGASPSAGTPGTSGSVSAGSGSGGAAGRPNGGGTVGGVGAEDTGGTSGGTMETGGSRADGSGGGAGIGGMGPDPSPLGFDYYLGVDVSFEASAPEATRANLLDVLKSHGINSIRLRTFVDPKASDGYDKANGNCDLAHTIAFGKQIKAAGMGLLIDFHYSDNWADPGKQCVPVAWQSYTTIEQLAGAVHDYTKDAITKLVAGGARPDLVQVGNETTPGMLIHRCDSGGSPSGNNPVTGSTSNWANLGKLLKAGVDGVKEVDPKILVSFHIAKGGDHTDGKSALQTSISWLTNALKYTPVDAFGESCYQSYQGDIDNTTKTKAIWETVEGGLAKQFPTVKIFAAEYGPMEREINDVIFNLPNQQGLGTFYWEPTTNGDWNKGHVLLSRSGSSYTAQPDLALYDQMKTAFASRL